MESFHPKDRELVRAEERHADSAVERVQGARSFAGKFKHPAILERGAKRQVARASPEHYFVGEMAGRHQIQLAVAVGVGQENIADFIGGSLAFLGCPRPERTREPEAPAAVPKHGDIIRRSAIAHHQIGPAVAVEIAGFQVIGDVPLRMEPLVRPEAAFAVSMPDIHQVGRVNGEGQIEVTVAVEVGGRDVARPRGQRVADLPEPAFAQVAEDYEKVARPGDSGDIGLAVAVKIADRQRGESRRRIDRLAPLVAALVVLERAFHLEVDGILWRTPQEGQVTPGVLEVDDGGVVAAVAVQVGDGGGVWTKPHAEILPAPHAAGLGEVDRDLVVAGAGVAGHAQLAAADHQNIVKAIAVKVARGEKVRAFADRVKNRLAPESSRASQHENSHEARPHRLEV